MDSKEWREAKREAERLDNFADNAVWQLGLLLVMAAIVAACLL